MRYDVRRRRADAICAVVLLLSAAGCTSTNGTEQPANSVPPPSSSPSAPANLPPVTDVPHLLDTATLKLPLDTYLPTIAEIDQASNAHRELIRRCMQRFDIQITIPKPPTTPGPTTSNERRYGLTKLAAAKIGYGFADSDPGTPPSATRPAPSLTAKALAVLTGEGANLPSGVPKGGCRVEARSRLTPVDPTTHKALDEELPERLSLDTFQRSQDDPRVKAAFADWSTCMKAKGHQYSSPFEPFGDPKFQPAGSAKERRTAEDDVACKASTNLVGRWYAVESAYQNALIADHKTDLTALAQAQPAIKELVRNLTHARGTR